MEVLHSRCCGLDVHKKSISACVMIREHGRLEKLERRFGTFTGELEDMAAWLAEHKVTHVVMEATGVYWKPVWNVLEGRFDLMLVNPQHIKALTGKKCDRRDASPFTELLQHGLLQGSFIPSAAIRRLRDLTRNRARTVQAGGRIKSRVQKGLEEANGKLGIGAADVVGVSVRLMLNGLVAGKQDPEELADLAVGVLRKKRDQLVQALSGKVDDHHRLMLGKLLRVLKTREVEIAEDETEIRTRIEPFRKAVLAWMQLPGIDEVTAWLLVAEMKADMAFDTAEQAASWACVCPGNHESASKQGDGRTRKGNPWLRSTICSTQHDCSGLLSNQARPQVQRPRGGLLRSA